MRLSLSLSLALCAVALVAAPAVWAAKHSAPAPQGRTDASSGPRLGATPAVRAFAAEMAQRHGWQQAWVLKQLGQAQRLPAVKRLMMPAPAGTAKDWSAYRDRFIEPVRVAAGVAFWRANQALLERAEQEFGVPPEIVVGIIGVETFYGRITGNFRVIDTLVTLAFDFPKGRSDRSAFFRDELEAFLLMAQRERRDPASFKGSYAGAMGLPQFMPSSLNRYAVDFDGDGHIDLQANPADVVGSVASYLAQFGWQRGLPTHHAVEPPTLEPGRSTLLGPDIVPSFTAAQFEQQGAVLSMAGRGHEGLLALVQVDNGSAAPSFVAGTQNFFVVTRYNRSSYYALAVIELGAAVRAAMP